MSSHRRRLQILLILLGAAVLLAVWMFAVPAYELREARLALKAHDEKRASSYLRSYSPAYSPEAALLNLRLMRLQGKDAEAMGLLARTEELGISFEQGRREFALLKGLADFPVLEETLKKVLEDSPNDPEVLQVLAIGYGKQGQKAASEAMFARWEAVEPHRPELFLQRALMYAHLDYHAPAVEDFRTYLNLKPEDLETRLLLANALLSDARLEEARIELEHCREHMPKRAEPLVGLAACEVNAQHDKAARQYLAEAIALNQDYVPALHLLANLELTAGKPQEALPILKRLVEMQPNDKKAHLNLAQTYRYLRDNEAAAVHERRYRQLDDEEVKKLNKRRGMTLP